jgi:proteasome accessory factor B
MISNVTVDRDPGEAFLRVRPGAGHSLRRQASAVEELNDSWSLISVSYTDTEAFAAEICGFGPDVVVTGPAELRESVIRRLTGALSTDEAAR